MPSLPHHGTEVNDDKPRWDRIGLKGFTNSQRDILRIAQSEEGGGEFGLVKETTHGHGIHPTSLADLFNEPVKEVDQLPSGDSDSQNERSPLLAATSRSHRHHRHRRQRTRQRGRPSAHRTGDDDGGGDDPSDGDDADVESLTSTSADSVRPRESLPWYRRPSPWWVIFVNPFIGVPITACVGAKVQLYTQLVCLTLRPEYAADWSPSPSLPSHISSLSPSSLLASFWNMPKLAEPSELCMADPSVQASVATLMAALGTTIGVLSILTTIAWSELSDRRGRTPFLGLTVFGTCLADVTFILVSYFYAYLPGGYHWLLFGYLLEGMAGGMTTAVAANNAYIADCSEPEARSSFFSLNLGIFCIGVAAGPTLGGILISSTNDLLSVFYLSATINLVIALVYWFIVPESLSKEAMSMARSETSSKGKSDSDSVSDKETGDLRKIVQTLLSSLSTLSMFYPRRVELFIAEDDESFITVPDSRSRTRSGNSSGGTVRMSRGGVKMGSDWNMFLVGVGVLGASLAVASYSFVFEYTGAQFHWRSEQIGYFLTATGATRTFHLMVLLPLATKFFKPSSLSPTPSSNAPGSGPDETPSSPSSLSPSERERERDKQTTTLLLFDLSIARFSLLLDLLGFVAMALAPSQFLFLLSAMLECLGAGFPAAIQSAALEIYRRSGGRETGKLFGALSVMQSVGSQIIGPSLFGSVYTTTVSTFPQAMFIVCAAALGLSVLITLPIRIRPAPIEDSFPGQGEESESD